MLCLRAASTRQRLGPCKGSIFNFVASEEGDEARFDFTAKGLRLWTEAKTLP